MEQKIVRFKKELIELIKNKPKTWFSVLKSTFKYILDDINLCVDKIFLHEKISTKAWCYLNNIHDYPVCVICGKKINNFKCDIHKGFLKTCSNECLNKFKYIQTKKACLKKYGVENVFSKREIIEKSRNTKLERYGDANYSNLKKQKQTNLKRYGVDNPAKSDLIKEKIKNTNLKKYGIECSLQNKEVKEKIKNTNLKRYGVDNPAKSDLIKEKIKNTNLKKYGVKFVSQNKEIRKKIKNTFLKKYGTEFPQQTKIVKNHAKQNSFKKYGCKNKSTYFSYKQILNDKYSIPLFTLSEYDKRNSLKEEFKFKCKKCGNIFYSYRINGYHKKCPKCYSHLFKSNLEIAIQNFLKNKNEILKNVRNIISPLELDIYIPDKKLAIEFDGLYWHSTRQKTDKNYHLKKTEACEKLGIQLIHIFENEWVLKQDIVKGYLNKLLDNFSKNINSDECKAKEIDSKITGEFLIKNYIFDFKISDINIGLYFNDELVSAIQIKKLNKENFELMSFCDKLNYKINNSLKRLLNYFEQKFKYRQIISYVDRRWDNGKDLINLNFQLKNISEPNCLYFKSLNFIKENTENCHKIYDCGNLVFVKNFKERYDEIT